MSSTGKYRETESILVREAGTDAVVMQLDPRGKGLALHPGPSLGMLDMHMRARDPGQLRLGVDHCVGTLLGCLSVCLSLVEK